MFFLLHAKALITAREVDVTGDDNSLLPDRLTLQDVVYVITNPSSGNRPGWVKISRDPSDSEGFGWVETKNIRTVSGYIQAGSPAPQSNEEDAFAGGGDIPIEEPIGAGDEGFSENEFSSDGDGFLEDEAPVENLEDDFVDEDALLAPLDEAKTISGCGPLDDQGKRRACANCTCGLAEQQASKDITETDYPVSLDDKMARASGCGGCSRGDAFRCASCPFLGKPAFEPGQERLVLSMSDDL